MSTTQEDARKCDGTYRNVAIGVVIGAALGAAAGLLFAPKTGTRLRRDLKAQADQLKQPADALKEFQATLKKEPNRFRTIYGAAKAASLSGDTATARKYYGDLLKIAAKADTPGRVELTEARKAVAGR